MILSNNYSSSGYLISAEYSILDKLFSYITETGECNVDLIST